MQLSIALLVLAAGVSAAPYSNTTNSFLVNSTSIANEAASSLTTTTTTILVPTTTADASSASSSVWMQFTLVNDYPFNATHPALNNTITGACKNVSCHTGYECHIYGGRAKCVIAGGLQCGDVWCPGNKQCCTTDSCNMCISLSAPCSSDTCASAIVFSP